MDLPNKASALETNIYEKAQGIEAHFLKWMLGKRSKKEDYYVE